MVRPHSLNSQYLAEPGCHWTTSRLTLGPYGQFMSVGPSGQEPGAPVEALAVALACAELAHIIDLVAYPIAGEPPSVLVRNAGGAVRLWRTESGEERHEVVTGLNPVANTDPLAFLPY